MKRSFCIYAEYRSLRQQFQGVVQSGSATPFYVHQKSGDRGRHDAVDPTPLTGVNVVFLPQACTPIASKPRDSAPLSDIRELQSAIAA
jgi:hypothetical protein